jgi:hypothetical protein
MRYTILLTAIVVLLYGCNKTDSAPPVVTLPNLPPAITLVGTALGNPVTKTIGPGGGTLMSADGRVELSFPANALLANTDISIQPVTNTAPGGAGVSYHLMPDGATFSVPVSLTFHYSAADENGTFPLLFYIAFQDSTGVWQADFKNRTVDTVAKTASLSISHFSFWSLGSNLYLFPFPPQVSESEKSELGVIVVNDEGNPTPNGAGEFSLSALPPVTPIPNSAVSNWAINGTTGGNAQNGTVSGTESTETYTAPAKIDKERTVQASGSISYGIKGWNKGRQVLQTTKFILFTNIVLQPRKLSFKVDVLVQMVNTSGVYGDLYSDGASFQVDLDHGTVTVSHFSNQVPNVTPPSGSYGLTEATWINDGTGLVNITQGLGIFDGSSDTIAIYLGHTGTVTPIWNIKDNSNGSSHKEGGDEVPGYPSGLFVIAKDSAQEGDSKVGTYSIMWNTTPIH